ncbi:MAG TPA: hypothetical protein DCF44_03450 [Chitinophagaceae bacterium]|nr:hypothetical protein [Chitinophagaceae bacterium]
MSTGRRGNTALQKMINCFDDPFLLTQDDVVDELTFTDFHIYTVQVFNKKHGIYQHINYFHWWLASNEIVTD